jgi:16S rRNA (uracil1498-N3)-methyltransferase
MAQRFYVPGPLTADLQLTLDSERSNYLCRVMRHQIGDVVEIFDGAGGLFRCQISSDNPRKTELKVLSLASKLPKQSFTLGIGLGLIKGQPMDRAIAQATELGATDIYLLDTQRSNVRINKQRLSGKIEHWQKVIIASCEQCGQLHRPKLHSPERLSQLLPKLTEVEAHLVFFDPTAVAAPTQLARQNRLVFIGPEGGFSSEELTTFTDNGADGYRLGSLTLRAETMPAAALTLVQQATGWPDLADP